MLTAVKIELDLDGRNEAGALVGRALAQVRDLSNLLRPSVLDDLGLVAALRRSATTCRAARGSPSRSTSTASRVACPPMWKW